MRPYSLYALLAAEAVAESMAEAEHTLEVGRNSTRIEADKDRSAIVMLGPIRIAGRTRSNHYVASAYEVKAYQLYFVVAWLALE